MPALKSASLANIGLLGKPHIVDVHIIQSHPEVHGKASAVKGLDSKQLLWVFVAALVSASGDNVDDVAGPKSQAALHFADADVGPGDKSALMWPQDKPIHESEQHAQLQALHRVRNIKGSVVQFGCSRFIYLVVISELHLPVTKHPVRKAWTASATDLSKQAPLSPAQPGLLCGSDLSLQISILWQGSGIIVLVLLVLCHIPMMPQQFVHDLSGDVAEDPIRSAILCICHDHISHPDTESQELVKRA